jgi:CheY-like chemotaxis protein
LHGLGAESVLAITQPIFFLQAACDIDFAQQGVRSVTQGPFVLDHSFVEAVDAVQETQPDMVLLCCLFEEVRGVVDEARRRGVNANAWVAASLFSDPRFRNDSVLADTYLFDVVGWDGSQDPSTLLPIDQSCRRWGAAGCITPRQFAVLYEHQFGFPPATEVAATFAAVDVMTQAMTASGSLDPTVVRSAVLDNGFTTAYGLVRFGFGSHQNYGSYIMRQNQASAVRVVAPSGFDTSTAVYPAPTWAQLACFDNGFCGSHGTCNPDGDCHCQFGWSGERCGSAAGLVLLCIGAALLGCIFIAAVFFAVRSVRAKKRAAAAAEREKELATRRTHTRTLTFAAHELSNPASIIALAAEELRMLGRERGEADRLLALSGVAPAGLGALGAHGPAAQRARLRRSYSYGSLPASESSMAGTAASEPSHPVPTAASSVAGGQVLPPPPPVVVTPTVTETENYVPLGDGVAAPAGASGGSPSRLVPAHLASPGPPLPPLPPLGQGLGLTLAPAGPQGLGLTLAPAGPQGLASIDEATYSAAAAGTPSAHPPVSAGAAAPSPGPRPQRTARPRYLLAAPTGAPTLPLIATMPGGPRLGAAQAAGYTSAGHVDDVDGVVARRRALQLAQAFAATRERREREAIRAIRRAARQMKRVLADMAIHSSATESLLMVAPLEADRDAISLAAVIRDVRHRLDQLHGVKVSAAVHEGVPNVIITDALRFQQVIAHSLALVHISALDCSQESGVELDIRLAPPEVAAGLSEAVRAASAGQAAPGAAAGEPRQPRWPSRTPEDEGEGESPVPARAILPVPVLVPRGSHSPVRKRRGPGASGGWASPPGAGGSPANGHVVAASLEGRSGESARGHAVSVLPGSTTDTPGASLGLPLEHAAMDGLASTPQAQQALGTAAGEGRGASSPAPATHPAPRSAGGRLRGSSSSSGVSPTSGPMAVLLITGACKPAMQGAQANGLLARGRKRRAFTAAMADVGIGRHRSDRASQTATGVTTTIGIGQGPTVQASAAAAHGSAMAAEPRTGVGNLQASPSPHGSGSAASVASAAPMLPARTYPAPPAAEAEGAPSQRPSWWSLLSRRVSGWLSGHRPFRLHPSEPAPPRPGTPHTAIAVVPAGAGAAGPVEPRGPAIPTASPAARERSGAGSTGGASARSKPRNPFSRALQGPIRQVLTPPPDRFAWVMGEDTCRRLAQSLGGTLVYELRGPESSFAFTVAVQAAEPSHLSTVSPDGEELAVLTQLLEQRQRVGAEHAVVQGAGGLGAPAWDAGASRPHAGPVASASSAAVMDGGLHGEAAAGLPVRRSLSAAALRVPAGREAAGSASDAALSIRVPQRPAGARDRSGSRGRGVGRMADGAPTRADRGCAAAGTSRLDSIAAARAAVAARPLGALVIDDEVVNCRLVRRQLERLGVTAIVLYDGADLDSLSAETVNSQSIILLDIVMPRSNGVQVGKEILRRGFRGTLVAMTANTSPDDVATYRAAGFHQVLGKPFTPDALTTLVQQVSAGTTPSTGSSSGGPK